jgi:hypothetical protein
MLGLFRVRGEGEKAENKNEPKHRVCLKQFMYL